MNGRLINKLLKPAEWFYPSAKMAYMWRLRRAYDRSKKGPILLLQMGKVGSKSVQAGLEALELDRLIYHAHFMSRDRTAKTEQQRRKFFRTERYSYLRRPWLNQFLLRTFQRDKTDRRWKLITLTREPVGRNISAFFENLKVRSLDSEGEFEISSDYYGIKPTAVSVNDPTKLAGLFFEHSTHDSPLRFFDREIRDIFGIDVLEAGFSPKKGYGIYHGDRVDLLVLKLESLDRCATLAVNEFLGIDDFEVINRNIGAKKVYAPLYDAFKKKAVVGADYANDLYDSRYMKTFYDDDEISAAKSRWGISNAC